MVNLPKFGGAFAVENYTSNNQPVDEEPDQRRMLSRYIHKYSQLDDLIDHDKSGTVSRRGGGSTGTWRYAGNTVILSDDELGDHFTQAKAIYEEANSAYEQADLRGDLNAMDDVTWDLQQAMDDLCQDALPAELEEINHGNGPDFRLNILS